MYIKVYCILAHKNPKQIQDLILLLQDEKSLFFIHLDKKENQRNYEILIQGLNCFFIKNRVKCSWGKYSLVQATLNAMKEVNDYIISKYSYYDYHFIMLSGEDLPLKNNHYIHDFLERNIQSSFMNYWELPYSKWWNGGLFRLENFYFFEYKKYNKLNYWINRVLKKIHFNSLFPLDQFYKQFPSFKLYGGSQWMILNKDLLQFVIDCNKANPKFNAIFKYVLAPDELYFSTLILNYNVNENFVICNTIKHLVCFSGLDASPKYLEISDIESIEDDFLFARKFDTNVNQNVIDKIKKTIIQ